jgi:hypothetical protein
MGYPAIVLRIGVPLNPMDAPPPNVRRRGAEFDQPAR